MLPLFTGCMTPSMQLLCPEEIEALVCGYPDFDAEGLKNATTYEGYERSDTTIQCVTSIQCRPSQTQTQWDWIWFGEQLAIMRSSIAIHLMHSLNLGGSGSVRAFLEHVSNGCFSWQGILGGGGSIGCRETKEADAIRDWELPDTHRRRNMHQLQDH